MGKLVNGVLVYIRGVWGSLVVSRLVVPLLVELRDIMLRVISRYFRDKFGMGDRESEDIARVVIRLVFREVERFIESRYGVVMDLDLDGV
jgi:hypothetical protein